MDKVFIINFVCFPSWSFCLSPRACVSDSVCACLTFRGLFCACFSLWLLLFPPVPVCMTVCMHQCVCLCVAVCLLVYICICACVLVSYPPVCFFSPVGPVCLICLVVCRGGKTHAHSQLHRVGHTGTHTHNVKQRYIEREKQREGNTEIRKSNKVGH